MLFAVHGATLERQVAHALGGVFGEVGFAIEPSNELVHASTEAAWAEMAIRLKHNYSGNTQWESKCGAHEWTAVDR